MRSRGALFRKDSVVANLIIHLIPSEDDTTLVAAALRHDPGATANRGIYYHQYALFFQQVVSDGVSGFDATVFQRNEELRINKAMLCWLLESLYSMEVVSHHCLKY